MESAILAHRAALEERTREGVALQWAAAQKNLGNALAVLGDRTDSLEQLREARLALGKARDVLVLEAGQQHSVGYFRRRFAEVDQQIESVKARRAVSGR